MRRSERRTFGPRPVALAAAVIALSGLVVAAGGGPARASTASSCTGQAPQTVSHVVVIVMENHGSSAILGSPSAPYISGLATACGLATSYHAVTHPSLPNYLAMTAGDTFGVRDDDDPAHHPIAATSIFQQLGTSWRSYAESMTVACQRSSAGEYAVKHNPAAYFTRLSSCATQDVPLPSIPTFSAALTFVTPNLVHDMHDGTVAQGDQWLAGFVPRLLAGPAYQSGSLALFIVWDENGGADAGPDNHVACLVVAPSVRPGSRLGTWTDHYSLLATMEDLLGLPRIAHAVGAQSLDTLLQHVPPPPPPKVFTTITPLLQAGHPDIVRAHVTHGTTTAYGTAPVFEGTVTLWSHNALTTRWSVAGTARTDRNGWAYVATRPRFWTAYRWTFSGTLRLYGTTSRTVAT